MTEAQPMKDIQKLMWSLGDYQQLARQFEPTAVALVEACRIGPGMEVLDVAAGTGNVAVAAARQGARVVASDLTPRMVELGRERSAAEGLDIEWLEADAEDLPFEDGRFDVVASSFGAMFAPAPKS
jgi:ubiquinone/menaquinone biosynthesis C-methylase UbiE